MRLLAALGLTLVFPAMVSAQAGVALLGRATDAGTDVSVQNAIVTLEGHGSTLTNTEGGFRFRGVAPGDYTLRVEAFGYATQSLSLSVVGDTTLALPLEPAPVPIDAIVVEAGTLDFHGGVRDAVRDFVIVDAQVLSRGRETVWTDTHGRFDLDDLPEGVPVSVTIRAFGYLPVDTTFIPDDDERHDFDLRRDAFAEAMIAMQVRRIDERAGGRVAFGRGVMDREEVLRYTGSHTASTMLDFELPAQTRERIHCVFLDERRIDGSFPPGVGDEIADFILGHTLPEEIERVELLQFDQPKVDGRRPLMLQIYTRSFIMEMATQGLRLRHPTITIGGQCF